MKKRKKRYIVSTILVLLIGVSIATNPTKKEYLQSTDWNHIPTTPSFYIERINFYLFSTYTPVVAHEHGITHLGIFGDFYQISDGQFDYPSWLEFFN
ncbi:hypothetical protein [Paenisporosarcina indica]|uniref:hypothetical protein n=1 Tax=Paenisporosarcina indica TaxID=650093 RepID=UPI000950349F|nr:hypothetical protein [Paenisporosarcina indica]